jgi:hypothetical protein
MITEAITISAILGGSAFAVWFAKSKFQPEIERSLIKTEAAAAEEKETILAKRGRSNNKTNQ